MNDKPVYLTEEGLQALKDELDELINVKRPALAKRLHAAIKQGDLSENADYIAAKEEQGFLEGRIQQLQTMIRNAQIIRKSGMDGRIDMGSRVKLLEEGMDEGYIEEYVIVGPTEAEPSKGKISYESPLGKALIGHREGEVVEYRAPMGILRFRILEVS